MAHRDIIVIGASAGGIQALEDLVRGLPRGLPAAVYAVVHISADAAGVLPAMLARTSALPVRMAADGEPIQHGRVHVAPPDHHLLLSRSAVVLSRGPKENGFRPAVDPLFRTAARAFGRRVIGIILSGSLDDGTDGLAVIKSRGGITIAQDPREALFSSMPQSAIRYVAPDYVLSIGQMPAVLVQLLSQDAPKERAMSKPRAGEDRARVGVAELAEHTTKGPPSVFRCPECGGALWEEERSGQSQFRCHVGHIFSEQAFGEMQAQEVESALWTAVRVLEEQAALRRRMVTRARGQKLSSLVRHLQRRADDAEEKATAVRALLVNAPVTRVKRELHKAARQQRRDRANGSHAKGNGSRAAGNGSRAAGNGSGETGNGSGGGRRVTAGMPRRAGVVVR